MFPSSGSYELKKSVLLQRQNGHNIANILGIHAIADFLIRLLAHCEKPANEGLSAFRAERAGLLGPKVGKYHVSVVLWHFNMSRRALFPSAVELNGMDEVL